MAADPQDPSRLSPGSVSSVHTPIARPGQDLLAGPHDRPINRSLSHGSQALLMDEFIVATGLDSPQDARTLIHPNGGLNSTRSSSYVFTPIAA